MEIQELLTQVSKDDKIEFLHRLLERNDVVRAQFISVFSPAGDDMDEDNSIDIEQTVRLIKDNFERIDFEPDWEIYVPRHSGYIPEYEAADDMAEDCLQEVLNEYIEQVKDELRDACIANACNLYVALYDAAINADFDCNNGVLEYASEFAQSRVLEFMPELKYGVQAVVLNKNQAVDFIKSLFNYYGPNAKDHNRMTVFEPLIAVFVVDEESAAMVQEMMDRYQVKKLHLPSLNLSVKRMLGKSAEWVKDAEELFFHDDKVAMQLLEHYKSENPEKFHTYLDKAVQKQKYLETFSEYIRSNASEKSNAYFQALHHLVCYNCDISDYNELRGFFSEEERLGFILKLNRNRSFQLELMAYEGWYDQIIETLKSFDVHNILPEYIDIVREKMPNETFQLISNKCSRLLPKEKGRDVYHKITSLLLAVSQAPAMKEKVYGFARQLVNENNRLYALRDELSKAGLYEKK